MSDVWRARARQWSLMGPPLTPAREDVAVLEAVAREAGARDALLLGVTPALATCAWPAGLSLTAVDVSPEMIAAVWPASSAPPGARALCADWRALPLGEGSLDLVAGDGVFALLDYPAGTRALLAEVARVLRPGGHFVVRLFTPPDAREDASAVVEALRAGKVGSFDAFRWRLLQALEESREAGVPVAAAWRAWNALDADPVATLAKLGRDRKLLETIEAYRDSRSVYWFPSAREVADLARDDFEHVSTHVHDYELGARFPTLVFRARGRRA